MNFFKWKSKEKNYTECMLTSAVFALSLCSHSSNDALELISVFFPSKNKYEIKITQA